MKSLRSLIISLLLLVASSSSVLAHAIHATHSTGGVVVYASFTDAIPAAGVFVSVFAPGETTRFAKGKTDRNGCFCFKPDKAGEWDVLVADRQGHRLQIKVAVDSSLLAEKTKDEVGGWPVKMQKILAGLALIALFFGCFGLFKRRRKGACEE